MSRALAGLALVAGVAALAYALRAPATARPALACPAAAALYRVRLGEVAGSLDPSGFMATVSALGDAPAGYLRTPVALRTPAIADVMATYEADPQVLARSCAGAAAGAAG